MIPYLYESDERTFTSNGIARLVDVMSCVVTEERNGIYELEMEYPISGKWFSEITVSRIIAAVPAEGKIKQPFRIYCVEKPINGVCTIYAEHISYELAMIPVMPFEAHTCAEALASMKNYAAQDCPFSFWTNKPTVGDYSVKYPRAIRELLGGSQGSILDVFGTGEYEFDKWLVRLHTSRGVDSGVEIRYGKNLSELDKEEDLTGVITGVCPYWFSLQTGEVVTLPEKAVWASTAENYPFKRTVAIDFTGEWATAPTADQLRARAQKYIEDNNVGIPKVSVLVSFVNLRDVEGVSIGAPSATLVIPASVEGETLKDLNGSVDGDMLTLSDAHWDISYDHYKVLERVNLCDLVTVSYEELGVSVKAEVVKTVYDVLLDRYKEVEIGEPRTTLARQVTAIERAIKLAADQAIVQSGFYANQVADTLTQYVDDQTALITGGQGGSFVWGYNADGQPEELFCMDTDDMATAINVIRFNKNGIGFSTHGINGPYASAWTIDGVFNADFIGVGKLDANLITVGTMLADRILGGTLKLGGLDNGNGVLEIYNSSGARVGKIDSSGITITGGLNASNANISGDVVSTLKDGNNEYKASFAKNDFYYFVKRNRIIVADAHAKAGYLVEGNNDSSDSYGKTSINLIVPPTHSASSSSNTATGGCQIQLYREKLPHVSYSSFGGDTPNSWEFSEYVKDLRHSVLSFVMGIKAIARNLTNITDSSDDIIFNAGPGVFYWGTNPRNINANATNSGDIVDSGYEVGDYQLFTWTDRNSPIIKINDKFIYIGVQSTGFYFRVSSDGGYIHGDKLATEPAVDDKITAAIAASGPKVKSESISTVVTNSSGSISTGLASTKAVLGCTTTSQGYVCIPFVSGNTWYVRVIDNTGARVVNTNIGVFKVYYIDT